MKPYFIALIISTGLVGSVFLYNKGLNDRQNQRIEEDRRVMLINLKLEEACLNRVSQDYLSTWNSNCSARGLKDNCTLPLNLAESINKGLKEGQDRCRR